MSKKLPLSYHDGHRTRTHGQSKVVPPRFEHPEHRYWWLAGWHDADMESGNDA